MIIINELYYSPAEAHYSSKEAQAKPPSLLATVLVKQNLVCQYKYPEYNLKITEEITNLEI